MEKSEKIDEIEPIDKWLKIKHKEKWSLLNNEGKYILESEYDDIKIVNEYIIGGKKNKYYALFDYSGVKKTGYEYSQLSKCRSTDAYLKAYRGGDLDVLKADGSPTGITSVFAVNENTLLTDQVVFKEKYWGVMNFNGDTIIAPKYDMINTTDSNNYVVKKNGMWGLLSGDGRVLIEVEYDEIKEKDDYYLGVIDEVGFIFDNQGKQISKVQYGWGPQRKVPKSLFAASNGDKLGVVNPEGEVIVDLKYDMIDSLDNGLIVASQGENKFLF